MKLTQEQMTYLSRFEGNMLTAVRSNWTSPLSASDLQMVADIYNKVTGQSRRANANCASSPIWAASTLPRKRPHRPKQNQR